MNKKIAAMRICMMILALYIVTTLGNRFKLDFTQESLYSLSEGTKSLLKEVDPPIIFKLYYSKVAANKGSDSIRLFNSYFQYVKSFLYEYEKGSNGKIRLEVIDPRPDTVEEEDALYYGIKRYSLSDTENYFFGLVMKNEAGLEFVIPFFDPEQEASLEYDITKAIYRLVYPQKKKIGLVTTLPMMGDNLSVERERIYKLQQRELKEKWWVMRYIEENFEVVLLKPTETKSFNNVDLLFIVHPLGFPDSFNQLIEDYLFKGGKMLVLVDPHNYIESQRWGMEGQESIFMASQMMVLFEGIGINLGLAEFAGDLQLAAYGQMGIEKSNTLLLPLMNCDKRCFEKSGSLASQKLQQMSFLFPGVLTPLDPKNPHIIPLITTTDQGNSYRLSPHIIKSPHSIELLFKPGTKAQTMGMMVTGGFKRIFNRSPSAVKVASQEAKVIVVADVDFIYDRMAFQQTPFNVVPANDNVAFILNALDVLSGAEKLLSIRSKGRFSRPFEVVDRIEISAKKEIEEKEKEMKETLDRLNKELSELSTAEKGLLLEDALYKKRDLAKKISDLRKELRLVRLLGRQKVEWLGQFFYALNTLFIPILLGFLAFYQFTKRSKRKSFARESL